MIRKADKMRFVLFLVWMVAAAILTAPRCTVVFADDGVAGTEAEAETAAPEPQSEEGMLMMPASGSALMAGGWDDNPPPVSPIGIGGAFSALMEESFRTDLATGAAVLGIPIVVPPGRKNVQPSIALSYSSNNENGICGVGWTLQAATAIQRSTKDGVPRYTAVDDFVAGGQELVMVAETPHEYEYRAKIESAFMKYVFLPSENRWVVYDKNGTKYYFGTTSASRLAHPAIPHYVFAWYVDKVQDVYGNTMTYTYGDNIPQEGSADNQLYLRSIEYTSNPYCNPPLKADKMVRFEYVDTRADKIYSRRMGWNAVIRLRLSKVRIFIDEDKDGVWSGDEVVWTYLLGYGESEDTARSLLTSVQLEDGTGAKLPAKTFQYQTLE